MLSTTKLDHYRTLGFFVLPDIVGSRRTQRLRAEVATAIRDAYQHVEAGGDGDRTGGR